MQAKFVEVILAECADVGILTFVVPTSTATDNSLLLFGGKLFHVIVHEWMDPNSKTYQILEGSSRIYTPDKILSINWEKEELEDKTT